jgi:hypothetical protein
MNRYLLSTALLAVIFVVAGCPAVEESTGAPTVDKSSGTKPLPGSGVDPSAPKLTDAEKQARMRDAMNNPNLPPGAKERMQQMMRNPPK